MIGTCVVPLAKAREMGSDYVQCPVHTKSGKQVRAAGRVWSTLGCWPQESCGAAAVLAAAELRCACIRQ